MSKQKSLVTLSIFVVSAFLMLTTRNFVHAVNTNTKVTICHATSSVTNPYTQIVVSENAIGGHFENPGTPKSGHELDLYFAYETTCPGGTIPTSVPTNTPFPTPTVIVPTVVIPTVVIPTAIPTTVVPTGNVDEGNIYDPCVLNRCPSATPTATPTATLTPTSTPAPTGTPNTGGGSNDGGSNNNSSSSSSSNSGSVQGATTTTLAATGVFQDMFMNMVGLAGVALSGLSAVMYAKKS